MQGVLACIDANGVSDCSGCLMGHGDVLLVLLSPRSSSERFGAGARPVHPIRDECDYGVACPKIADERTRTRRPINASDPDLSAPGSKESTTTHVRRATTTAALLRIRRELQLGLFQRGTSLAQDPAPRRSLQDIDDLGERSGL